MFKLPEEIISKIKDYHASLKEFLDGRIDFSRFTAIRVPWGFYSHRGKKVFMARIRIPGGVVIPAQLKAIAEAAKNFGSGLCHITTRQDIQVHGIKIEDTIKVIEFLKDYELSPRAGGGNTVRNITVCPLSGICKDEIFEIEKPAIALTEYLLRQESSYNLPRKFKIAFSGCTKDCAGCLINDLGFLAKTQGNKKGFQVFAGGGMGARSALGKLLEDFIPEEDLGYCTEAVKRVFYKNGDRKSKQHNRLRFLIGDLGFAKFKELYELELKELKEKEYIVLRRFDLIPEKKNHGEIPKVQDEEFVQFLKFSVKPQKQKDFSIIKLRIPRGDLQYEQLFELAELEKTFSGIEFRTSQHQNIYIAWVKNQQLLQFFLKLKTILSDFLYPETLLDVVTCKGALTCNLGLCNSPGLSRAIENVIKKEFIGERVFQELEIKLNGCPNSCGHAPVGKIAFFGMVKRVDNRPVPFYKLLLGGKIAGPDTEFGQEIGIIPAKNIPAFLKRFLSKVDNLKNAKDIARKILAEFSFVPSYSENPDFYKDWDKQEDFSLAGLGPGECGAGVIDMIESDLTQAKIAFEEAKKQDYSVEEIRKVLFLASRSLLVVKGKDPKTEEEAVFDFYQKFILEDIASSEFANLREVLRNLTDKLNAQERKEKFTYAEKFLEHINQLYKTMDSSFNFLKQEPAKSQEQVSLLQTFDLLGTPCPMNYVKIKLFLENLKANEIVEVLLDEGEPINNVPKSLESDGNKILKIEKYEGFYKVTVQKGN